MGAITDSSRRHAQQVIVLKIKASKELGAWADMITICKKELDTAAFAEAQCVKEDLSMSLPFTAKSGYGAAVAGCPKLIASITAQILGSKVNLTFSLTQSDIALDNLSQWSSISPCLCVGLPEPRLACRFTEVYAKSA